MLYTTAMKIATISGGIKRAHALPNDLRRVISQDKAVLACWEDITPLARNEFICWVENAKAIETRERRIKRTAKELLEGKRRPCCWIGCMHRIDKELSKTQKWIASGKK